MMFTKTKFGSGLITSVYPVVARTCTGNNQIEDPALTVNLWIAGGHARARGRGGAPLAMGLALVACALQPVCRAPQALASATPRCHSGEQRFFIISAPWRQCSFIISASR
jgi:hypothetical protein